MKNFITLLIISLTTFAGIAQVERTLIVEHYTNTLCGTCAARNVAFYELLANYPQVLHISYHPSAPYTNCVFSLHNPAENDERTHFYGIYGGTPRVVLQGEVIGYQTPILNAGQIDAQLGQESDYMVHVKQENTGDGQVNVQIIVKMVSQANTQAHDLYAVIAEKKIDYDAPNGENEHFNVFRKVLVNQAINITNPGDSIVINTSYDIHDDWKDEEMIVTAMVQEKSSKTILQAYESDKLDAGSSFINDKEMLSLEGKLYPNPARDMLYLGNTGTTFVKAEFFAVTGNLVKSFSEPSSMNISELPEGIYMVVLTDNDQQKHITRVIKI